MRPGRRDRNRIKLVNAGRAALGLAPIRRLPKSSGMHVEEGRLTKALNRGGAIEILVFDEWAKVPDSAVARILAETWGTVYKEKVWVFLPAPMQFDSALAKAHPPALS